MKNLEPLQHLIERLAKLPGVGRRSAERMAFRLALDTRSLRRDLMAALDEVEQQVTRCSRCGNLTLKSEDPCAICRDPRRDAQLLCVVEDPLGLHQIEAAGAYQGLYFCAMGRLSPAQGSDVPPQRVRALVERIRQDAVREVVLAFDTDVESDATAAYLREQLAETGVAVTRLALGMPAGSGLAYADPVTLTRAFRGRTEAE
jgi:recombination protein RecR